MGARNPLHFSIKLTIEELTQALGVTPTEYSKIGDPISSRLANKQQINCWSLSAPELPDLTEQVAFILEAMSGRELVMEQIISSLESKNIYIGWSADNDEFLFLTSEQIKKIGSLGLDIVVDTKL